MKTWKVAIQDASGVHYYMVDAEDKKAGEARAYRLHCSTPNWNPAKRAYVQEQQTVEWGQPENNA